MDRNADRQESPAVEAFILDRSIEAYQRKLRELDRDLAKVETVGTYASAAVVGFTVTTALLGIFSQPWPLIIAAGIALIISTLVAGESMRVATVLNRWKRDWFEGLVELESRKSLDQLMRSYERYVARAQKDLPPEQ